MHIMKNACSCRALSALSIAVLGVLLMSGAVAANLPPEFMGVWIAADAADKVADLLPWNWRSTRQQSAVAA